jgi:hypothetical protein
MSAPGPPRVNGRVKASLSTLEFWWTPPINDGGFIISNYILLCSSIPYSTIINGSTTYAKVSTLTNTQDYTFQVAAQNNVGIGPLSIFPIAQPGAPSATGVMGLTATSNNASTATVSWSFTNNLNEGRNKYFALTVIPSTITASISTFRLALYANQRSHLVSNLSTMNYTFLVQSINDAAYSNPTTTSLLVTAPPVPARLSGVQLWLDGNSPGGNPSNNAALTSWQDKSGNGRNVTLTGNPVFQTGVVNGLAAVNFTSATNNAMYGTTLIAPGTFIGALNVFVVYRYLSSQPSGSMVLERAGPPISDGVGLLSCYNVAVLVADNASVQNFGYPNIYRNTVSMFNQLVSQQSSSNSFYAQYLNATQQTTTDNNNPLTNFTPSDTKTNFNIGSSRNGNLFSGYYCELVVFNVALSTSDRQLMEGYLAWKWGIQAKLPEAHPYAFVAPP